RDRGVVTSTYLMPYNPTARTVSPCAAARPFNATTGGDNNGDGANNDRPIINGAVVSKSAFLGTGTQDVSVFVEERLKTGSSRSLLLRLEVFNLFNHGNMLGRAQTIYGDAATPNPTFGQLVATGTATNALPALANIDPPRMFQLQARFLFYRPFCSSPNPLELVQSGLPVVRQDRCLHRHYHAWQSGMNGG